VCAGYAASFLIFSYCNIYLGLSALILQVYILFLTIPMIIRKISKKVLESDVFAVGDIL